MGKLIGRITLRHRAKEFLAFLQEIDRSTLAELDLYVILDNSSTHKTPVIKQWRGVFTGVAELKTGIRQFIEAHNEHSAKPFKWNKTAATIISSVLKAKLGAIKNGFLN